jgi:hypothetical protein
MVRLCQRDGASCGACCGLHATARPGRAAATAELWRRTRGLAGVARTAAAFREAAARLSAGAPRPVIPTVSACPLLGFIDEAGTRVGCLAHPAVTGGPDLREAGAYDAETCESFLCPSHAALSEEVARIVERASPGWHAYGLAITDAPFVRAVLAAVAEVAGEPVASRHLDHAPFRAALGRLLSLKADLAAGSDGLFACFSSGRAGLHQGGGARDGSQARAMATPDPADAPHQWVVAALGADERSGNDVERLEAEARRLLQACLAALPPRA